jgi:hypothetical protein
VACVAALGLLAVVYYWPCSFSDRLFPFGGGDCLNSYFPYLVRAFDARSAEMAGPWVPSMFTGLPESHTPFGRYYPLHLLFYGLLRPVLAFNLLLVAHQVIAGCGAMALARQLRLGWAAALLAGLVFGFGGMMTSKQPAVNMVATACWIPWVIWCLERFRQGGGWHWAAAAGTVMGVHSLAGYMQGVLIGASVWVLYGLYFAGMDWWRGEATEGKETERTKRTLLGGLATACGMGAALGLPQWLPMMEVARWTTYNQFDEEFFYSGALPPRNLVLLWSPHFVARRRGAAAESGLDTAGRDAYMGLIPFTWAAATLLVVAYRGVRFVGRATHLAIRRRKSHSAANDSSHSVEHDAEKRVVGFWCVLAIVSLLLMLGEHTPLYRAAGSIPIYNRFHVPARHAGPLGLAVALLAACALDGARLAITRRTLVALTVGVCAGAAVGVWWLWVRDDGWHMLQLGGLWRALLLSVVAATMAGLLDRGAAVRWSALLVVGVVTYLDLWSVLASPRLNPRSVEALLDPGSFPPFVQFVRQYAGLSEMATAARSSGASESGDEPTDEPASPAGPPAALGATGAACVANALLPPRCLIMPGKLPVAEGSSLVIPAGFPSVWGLSSLCYYSQSHPATLSQVLGLDRCGRCTSDEVLAANRGLSALGGRFVVTGGPMSLRGGAVWREIVSLRSGGWRLNRRPAGRLPQVVELSASPDAPVTLDCRRVELGPGVRGEIALEARADARPHAALEVRLLHRGTRQERAAISIPPDALYPGPARVRQAFDARPAAELCVLELRTASHTPISLLSLSLQQESAVESAGRSARPAAATGGPPAESPYVLLESFADGTHVYENRQARPPAMLVQEVRPVASVVEAAARTAAADGPAPRAVAHVVLPAGSNLDIAPNRPTRFATGRADIVRYRGDDIWLHTAAGGDSFLVLAVTRCMGWSATIDGEGVPIHAVDGPLMGIRVPPGRHTVRLRFRPVLVWAGVGVALAVFGTTWGGLALARWRGAAVAQRRAGTSDRRPTLGVGRAWAAQTRKNPGFSEEAGFGSP